MCLHYGGVKMDNIQTYKDVLLKRKQELENTIHNMIENGMFGMSLQEVTKDLSTYDNHSADLGSETYEQEKDFALIQHEKYMLQEVNDALQRIDNGSYGICDFCGTEINPDRLEVIPETHLCYECAKTHKAPLESVMHSRPVEETVLREIHGNYFGHLYPGNNQEEAFDELDIFKEFASYGTADSMQDLPGVKDYKQLNDLYIDQFGIIEPTDMISTSQQEDQLT